VVHLHVLQTDRRLIVRQFAHVENTRETLEELERLVVIEGGRGEYLTADECRDELDQLFAKPS
jgi:hypothetical protein